MKKIIDYEDYSVSNLGEIFSTKYGKIRLMKNNIGKDGYIRIKLYNNNNNNKTFLAHRLVAGLYIDNTENKKEVNHKNGNKLDNRVDNLEWCTPSENVIHSYKNGLQSKKGLLGEKNPQSKLKKEDILFIFNSNDNNYSLAEKYKVSFATIYDIKSKRTWKQITNNI